MGNVGCRSEAVTEQGGRIRQLTQSQDSDRFCSRHDAAAADHEEALYHNHEPIIFATATVTTRAELEQIRQSDLDQERELDTFLSALRDRR